MANPIPLHPRPCHREEPIRLPLHFTGPLSFAGGPASLFASAHADAPCVYLWTFRQANGRYFIHYIGEAARFARRQRQHLVDILGLNYGIFDAAAARGGEQKRLRDGLWRMRSPDGPSRALEYYDKGRTTVLEYVNSLAVFVTPLDGDAALRRHVEGSIGRCLRRRHEKVCALYPRDNRIGGGRQSRGIRLEITSDARIAGLDQVIEI